jgi:glycosyltransferase involved in cell wall biosynthesis
VEALSAGCPLIISNKTPWLNLEEQGIGWDLSLDEPQTWIEKLNFSINLDQSSYNIFSDNARKFALKILKDKRYEENTLTILKRGLEFNLASDS